MKHHAKAVFIGEVLEVREATKEEREEYSNFYIVRMRVQRYWKGIKSGEVKCGDRLDRLRPKPKSWRKVPD